MKTKKTEGCEQDLLQKAGVEGEIKEDGVYEITSMIGSRLEEVVKMAKEIARTKKGISVVKVNFNGVTIIVTEKSDETKIIQDYYNRFNVRTSNEETKVTDYNENEVAR